MSFSITKFELAAFSDASRKTNKVVNSYSLTNGNMTKLRSIFILTVLTTLTFVVKAQKDYLIVKNPEYDIGYFKLEFSNNELADLVGIGQRSCENARLSLQLKFTIHQSGIISHDSIWMVCGSRNLKYDDISGVSIFNKLHVCIEDSLILRPEKYTFIFPVTEPDW